MKIEKCQTAGRLYAIGDLHGCSKEVKILLDHLAVKERLTNKDRVVFVGDYIDRGPDSKGVISALIDFKKSYPETVFLKGNHEDMLLDYLGYGGNLGNAFIINGGLETLRSYKISVSSSPCEIKENLPVDHLNFFVNLSSLVIEQSHIIVHAGLDPLRSVDSQVEQDLYWIREDFISSGHQFDKTVVFGHTPQVQVLVDLPYKIGIDTGLVFGNILTCMNLTEMEVLQLRVGKTKVRKQKLEKIIGV